MLPLRYLNTFLLTWLEAHEHRQDPGENGRRIEKFSGENEHLLAHLSQIIGGRPVYCQNLINGGRRGKVTSRYMRTAACASKHDTGSVPSTRNARVYPVLVQACPACWLFRARLWSEAKGRESSRERDPDSEGSILEAAKSILAGDDVTHAFRWCSPKTRDEYIDSFLEMCRNLDKQK